MQAAWVAPKYPVPMTDRRRLTREDYLPSTVLFVGIPGVRIRARAKRWRVEAVTVDQLQQLCVTSVGQASVTSLEIHIATWSPPKGWIGTPAAPGLVSCLIQPQGGGVQVALAWVDPVDVALALAAAVRCLRPVPDLGAGPMLTFAPGLPAAAAALAANVRDVVLPSMTTLEHLRRCDTLLVPSVNDLSATDLSKIDRASTVVVEDGHWTINDTVHEVWVDPTVHNPIGRRSINVGQPAEASVECGVLKLRGESFKLAVTGDLQAADVQLLRAVNGVHALGDLGPRWVNQLGACGIAINAEPSDALGWQVASVRARSDALRRFTPLAALARWPAVSAVLLTNRDTYLAHAMEQISRLDYPNLQVIVGLHGFDLPAARLAELRELAGRGLEFISVAGSVPFGAAMQVASQRAEGELITKIDDDDYYGAAHVWDLVLARMYSGAQVVGKALDWIHLEGENRTVFRPVYDAEKYSFFVAGGTILISRADLDGVGGWRPVTKSIDRALLESVQLTGGLIYRTHGLGYLYVRHLAPHTAAVADKHFLTKTQQTWDGLLKHEVFGTAP